MFNINSLLFSIQKRKEKRNTVGVPWNSDDLIYTWHHCGTYQETQYYPWCLKCHNSAREKKTNKNKIPHYSTKLPSGKEMTASFLFFIIHALMNRKSVK